MAVNAKPHQLKAVEELKCGSVLRGGVGSGKSRVALLYYFTKICGGQIKVNGVGESEKMMYPTDLVIITTAKKRDHLDWQKECAAFGLTGDRASSFSGIKVAVDSWNNIGNYEDVKYAFFVFDEQRLVGNGAWVKSFIKIAKANMWIMLSATPGDVWLDYAPVFIANGFYKNKTEFMRRHVVFNNFSEYPKIDHYVERHRLERLRREITVEMPFNMHTTRHVQNVFADFDKAKFDLVAKKRWNVFEDRPIKDVGELFRVMRKLVNSDVSRLIQIQVLMEKHPRLIIFYNFDYELDMLRTLGPIFDIPLAEWNGHKHEEIPDTEKWFYLVQYTAGAEGWNCTSTNAVIFFSLNYSYKINQQAKGRIDRMDTLYTDLYYYVFRSNSLIDNAIVKSLASKKNFNEKRFVSNKGMMK